MTDPTKMRRYKIVACIILILSVFSFVLAAPVAVQEVRDTRADAVDDGGNVIIGLGERAEEDQGSFSTPTPSGESQPPLLSVAGD